MMSVAADSLSSILFWLLVLLLCVLSGGSCLYAILRWLRKTTSDAAGGGFTLHALRELREQGDLTENEFLRASASLTQRLNEENTDAGNDEEKMDYISKG